MLKWKQESIKKKNQIDFIKYLNGEKYMNNYKNFKFLIIECKDTQEELEMLLQDIFEEPIFLFTENEAIVIYHDFEIINERVYLDIILSLSLDSGEKIKVFKGCTVNVENNQCLLDVYDCFLEFKNKDYICADMTNMVLDMIHKNKNLLLKIKKSVLYKISQDKQLIKLILAMFDNDLNVTKTAGFMYMHRNTINNKIDYIKKETGFNIQNFKDAMALYILIKMI